MKQDDPRKCTAAKLAKFRLATPLFRMRQVPRMAIVLNPFAPRVLLPGDALLAEKSGIVAVDCSWERIEKAFATATRVQSRELRKDSQVVVSGGSCRGVVHNGIQGQRRSTANSIQVGGGVLQPEFRAT